MRISLLSACHLVDLRLAVPQQDTFCLSPFLMAL
jgi:hypothetical protein